MDKFRLILIAFSMTLLFIGCQKQTEESNEKEVPVRVINIETGSISSYIKATGSIIAENDAVLFSKINEKIDEILVSTGQSVRKDQIIAVQYNEIFRQGVELAKASVQNAEAQLNLILQDYARFEKLFNQNAISVQQFEQIKTQKTAAESGLEQAKAGLHQAEEQFQNSFIKSPFAGIVASIYVEKDQMLPMGQPIAQIVGSSDMKTKLNISSIDMRKVNKGQNVIAKFPAISNQEFKGIITEIDYAVNQITKSLNVEVRILEKDPAIKSGMFGEFYIETDKRENTIVVPDNAVQTQTEVILNKSTGLMESLKKYFIYKVSDNRAKHVEVTTGINSKGQIEILSGLNIGDKMIVVGQSIVKEGQLVRIVD